MKVCDGPALNERVCAQSQTNVISYGSRGELMIQLYPEGPARSVTGGESLTEDAVSIAH